MSIAVLTCISQLLLQASTSHDEMRIGCFYFPGWYSADRWTPIVEYGHPKPLLGCYKDDSPQAQDWHIRWARQHGVSFWVFDWYYDYRTGQVSGHNVALEKGFLRASLRSEMDFAVMWCNEEAGAPVYTREEMLRLVSVLTERYLNQSNYLRVDGRSVLVFSRPLRIIERFGEQGTRSLFREMSDAAKAHGGFFFIGNADPSHTEALKKLKRGGFDALTLYCYTTQGMKDSRAREAPYDEIVPAVEATWRAAAGSAAPALIPTVSTGWDSRPWYGDSSLRRTGSTPEKFGQLCRIIAPLVDPDLKMVMIGTWNEFGEGSHIEPTEEWGFGYLDALRRAFFPNADSHEHLVPNERELEALTFRDVPAFLDRDLQRQKGNLVINPGFERDWGWVYFDHSPAQYEAGLQHSGERCLVVPKEKAGAKMKWLAPGIPWKDRWVGPIPAQQNQGYKVSVWVRGRARINCALFNKQRQWLHRYQFIAEGGYSDKWTMLADQFSPDAETAFFNVEVVALDETIYADDVCVMVGK